MAEFDVWSEGSIDNGQDVVFNISLHFLIKRLMAQLKVFLYKKYI